MESLKTYGFQTDKKIPKESFYYDWIKMKNGNNVEKRKKSERLFHDRYFGGKAVRSAQAKFYDEKLRRLLLKKAYEKMDNVQNKKILYLGCGSNTEIMHYFIRSGARVVAIDISQEAVKTIKRFIEQEKIMDRAEAILMDAEKLEFNDAEFDGVFGRAIVHHLDIKKIRDELCRVLKKNGKAVFIEPLGMNPFINLYRFLTPKDRTSDEHPLCGADLEELKNSFSRMEQERFFLFALLAFFWKTLIKNEKMFGQSFDMLCRFDRFILGKLTFLKKFCWCTIITLYKSSLS
ncbi:MAG: class I SAM-dependent methyltransferase [Candidatus Omnitrophota bacterium]